MYDDIAWHQSHLNNFRPKVSSKFLSVLCIHYRPHVVLQKSELNDSGCLTPPPESSAEIGVKSEVDNNIGPTTPPEHAAETAVKSEMDENVGIMPSQEQTAEVGGKTEMDDGIDRTPPSRA
jgi:hypothetical protein